MPTAPKAYWIAHVNVTDPERYKGYQSLAPHAFRKYGARFLTQGGVTTILEGEPWDRNVVIEFKDRETALECYNSHDYRQARAERSGACLTNIMITDGISPDE